MPAVLIISAIIVIAIILVSVVLKNVLFSSKIERAAKLMDSNNYNEAIRELKKIIAKNDANSRAHFLLAECYYKKNNYEWAMPEYRAVLKLGNFKQNLSEHQVRSRLAQIYLHYNKLEEAQKEFLLMSKLQPNNFLNYYNIGKIFQDRNYLDNAYTYFRKALQINPDHLDSLFKAGEISFRQNRSADALIELQAVLKQNPDYYKAHYFLGMIYLQNKNYLQAIKEFEYSARDSDFKLMSLAQKGRAYFETKDYDKAILDLERAQRLIKSEGPATLAIRYYLSLCYEQKRQLEKAIELWEKILKLNPNYQDVQEKLANYAELRTDDKLKDFLIASNEEFIEKCKDLISYLGMDIIEMNNVKGIKLNIIATQSESKWRNTRRIKRYIRILRTNDIIGDALVREVLDEMKEYGAMKGMVITSNQFSRQAVNFAQTRPIDLIDKEGLSKLLTKLERQNKA